MKRWLMWLGIGLALFTLVGLTLGVRTTREAGAAYPLFLLAGIWLWITVIAVPVSIFRWLTRGNRRD